MANLSSFKNRDEWLEYHRTWRMKNRKKMRDYKREYNKKYRAKFGLKNEYASKKRYPHKERARYLLQKAVKLGVVIKGPCEVCGTTEVQAHHDNYKKPLTVRWFCPLHHSEIHKRFIYPRHVAES